MFELHPQLANDGKIIIDLPLCRVLLLNDSLYPWLILVPRREGISEVFQLKMADQDQLSKESCLVAKVMAGYFNADKMNIAALGNVVPQLHVHHIVRYRNDPAWPKPVWGEAIAVPYIDKELEDRVLKIRQLLVSIEF